MDELIDILDQDGNYTQKVALKSKAHTHGWWHPTVHVWCYDQSGKILLQQRGKNKKTFPLKWDVSVAGHIGAGETVEQGAVREAKEEIGIEISGGKLEKIGVFKSEEKHSDILFDREFNHTFLYQLFENIPLIKQESEVEALKWVTLDEFKNWIANKQSSLIPNSDKRFQFVISEIELRL